MDICPRLNTIRKNFGVASALEMQDVFPSFSVVLRSANLLLDVMHCQCRVNISDKDTQQLNYRIRFRLQFHDAWPGNV